MFVVVYFWCCSRENRSRCIYPISHSLPPNARTRLEPKAVMFLEGRSIDAEVRVFDRLQETSKVIELIRSTL